MTLPAVSAAAGSRFAAALVLLVAVMLRAGPLFADEAADFAATVTVDATADTVDKARDLARLDGQRRALAAVVTRLSGAADAARLAKLDNKTITDMVESLDVADEQMSAVHYVADYTFHFQPAKVRPLLQAAVPPSAPAAAPAPVPVPVAAESGGRPVVVLPVYRQGDRMVLWDDPNPWREAWSQQPETTAPIALAIPLGDAGDVATIDAPAAAAGDAGALAAIARHNGGDDAIVALATARQQDGRLAAVDVGIKRYHAGQLQDGGSATIAVKPGETEPDFFKRAAVAVAAQLESGAGQPAAQAPGATLTATVPLDSLADWVEVRRRLASLAAVKEVDLLSLTRREARIAIRYVGSADDLRAGLAAADLDLAGSELRRTAAAGRH